MNIDLHCHTNVSDGSLTPVQLLEHAAEREIDMLAITDHDTVQAYQQLQPPKGLQLITGVEISTTWQRRGVHIVGLNIDLNCPSLQQGLQQQMDARLSRAERIAQRLEKLGFKDTLPGARRYAQGGYIGRPHFAQYLVECGAVKSVSQAFDRYLGSGKPGDIKEQWAAMTDVIRWINDAGGHAVLAHPAKYKLTRTKLLCLVDDFIAAGGTAMEVLSGQQIPSLTRDLTQICNQKQLLASVGSDFHHRGQAWAALGCVAPLPESCKPLWECF